MKKLVIFFTLCTFMFSEDFGLNIFLGQDYYGKMKIDKTDVKESFSEYRPSVKLTLTKNIYNHIDFITSVQYENYHMDAAKNTLELIPLTGGFRYFSDKKENKIYDMSMAVGTNVVLAKEGFDIDTSTNGFGELACGILYNDKYMGELVYKHTAFNAKNPIDGNDHWNGQMLAVNVGYKIK